jgi:hypothetical protein
MVGPTGSIQPIPTNLCVVTVALFMSMSIASKTVILCFVFVETIALLLLVEDIENE